MKKLGKTTRPFRYDLNQMPFDYTVEVRNRFKGPDLIEYLMNYEWRFVTLYRRQGSSPSPWKINEKSKMAVWGGLTNSCEKKRSEKQRRKGKIYPFECRVPKNFQMFKLVLEKAEEPEIKLPTSAGPSKNHYEVPFHASQNGCNP